MRRSTTSTAQLFSVAARIVVATVLSCATAGLGGCGSLIADIPVVGLPADAPPRKDGRTYLPVHDLPAERETPKIETAEQGRIRAELAAARAQQAAAAAAAAK